MFSDMGELIFLIGYVKTLIFMFFHTCIVLIFLVLCRSDIEILDAGIGPINEGDIAMIFYLTIENKCDKDLEISVHMEECCEQTKENQNDCKMLLIGGHMGMLNTKIVKNVTLIYPNLYLLYRQGSCTIAVKYTNEKYEKVMNKVIEFKTNATTEDRNLCPTMDTDPLQECKPQDCVIKYSGEKSYFNPSTKECECVPFCVSEFQKAAPEIAYSCINNICMNLNGSITKLDLENLESNQIDTSDPEVLGLVNAVCHNGEIDSSGECQCQNDWKTTLDDEAYEPSLLFYHMCNVETGGWNCVNRSKIKTTALIIAIFAVTIASKILILMCLLNWCYRQFKVPKETKACIDRLDPSDKSLLISENIGSFEKCICEDMKKNRSPTLLRETVNVSFYPCTRSTKSSVNVSVDMEKNKRKTMSGTTTTSSMPISFETGTEETTEDSDDTGGTEEDYEIEFSEEEEFCGDEECPRAKTSEEPTDFTETPEERSKKGSSKSTKSKVSSAKSSQDNKKTE